MPPGATGSRANPDSLAKWTSLAETRAASLAKLARPDSRGKGTSRPAEVLVRRAHPVAVRTAGRLVVRAAALGLADMVQSIANGMAAIPEAIGRRVAKRSRCPPRRRKFNAHIRKPCAS